MGGRHASRRRRRDSTVAGPPTSDTEKWAWLLEHGRPAYMDKPSQELDTGWIVSPPPADLEAQRLEVQRIAQRVFDQASTAGQRATVARAYVSQFPHLAFERDAWFWEPYWVARARRGPEDMEILRAVANGIKASAPGWMTKQRFKASQVAAARQYLRRLNRKREWKQWYDASRETHPTDTSVAERAQQYRARLIDAIERETGYRPSPAQIRTKGLAAVLMIAVHEQFNIPEHDLH